MERKVGEIFTYNGKIYKVAPGYGCKNCDFKDLRCLMRTFSEVRGACDSSMRKDNNNVIFKEVKKHIDIKNNQLTIDIPEGMEIDLENSDLAKGIIRFKYKSITYIDVEDALNLEGNRTAVAADVNNVSKLSALDKLMNIARYYNKDWKPNWGNSKENKYCIKFDYHKGRFYEYYNNPIGAGDVFFKNSEDARAVINNPNFKDILDTIYKN